jgi:hypothetical protein
MSQAPTIFNQPLGGRQQLPPYDASGNTALLGANLLFEMLCVLPGVHYR